MATALRNLGPVEHLAGAISAYAVLAFETEITQALVAALSPVFLGPGRFIRFGAIAWSGGSPVLGVLSAGFVLWVAAVCFDRLRWRGWPRIWLPPVFMASAATTSVIAMNAGTGDRVNVLMVGMVFGPVVGLAFSAWWFAGLGVAQVRGERTILKAAIQGILAANRELARQEAEGHQVLRELVAVSVA